MTGCPVDIHLALVIVVKVIDKGGLPKHVVKLCIGPHPALHQHGGWQFADPVDAGGIHVQIIASTHVGQAAVSFRACDDC